jgi:RHS repeat-associated protein
LAGTLYREAFWLVADHLGTPRMLVNKSGTLAGVKRHDYLPFGEELSAGIGGRTTTQGYTGDSVRQHFTGYEADGETGLNFAQARYQSPAQGRFTSVDPFGASASVANPQSFNRYSYVENTPLNAVDPRGTMLSDIGVYQTENPEVANTLENEIVRRVRQMSSPQIPYVGDGILQRGEVPGDEPLAKTNPNSIEKAVEGGTLGPTNNIEADTRTGGNIHDGIHVESPVGELAEVTALPAMAGSVDHAGRQGVEGNPSYNYSVVYIILRDRFQGQRLVLSLVDMHVDTGTLKTPRQRVVPGTRLGFVSNSGGPGESGLHVTLMTLSTYNRYIRNRWSYAARRSVPTSLLIDAARDPRSPFRSQ